MASKFGLAGGLPERRVRPIWDAIDSRQFKNALKAVTTLLSKYPNAPYALVTKYNPSFSAPDSESLWFQFFCILMVISCFLVSHFSIALSVFSGFILSFLFPFLSVTSIVSIRTLDYVYSLGSYLFLLCPLPQYEKWKENHSDKILGCFFKYSW